MQLLVYYVSHSMLPAETRYSSLEKQALALLIASNKLKKYFQPQSIVVFTSHSLRHVLHQPKALGCLMQWSIELRKYEIRYLLRAAIKGQAVINFIAEMVPNEEGMLSLNSGPTIREPPMVLR